MSGKQESLGAWSLLAGWTLASSMGWFLGLGIGTLLTLAASRLPWLSEDRVFAYAVLISLGLTTGAAQWIVMRRYLPQPAHWVAGTLVGYLLCLVIVVGGNLGERWAAGIWDDVLLLGFLGAAIGTAQWWILRQHYRQAGLWLLATAAGFLCFVWTIRYPALSPGQFVLRGTLFGTLAAAVPGAALVWLVHQPSATGSQRTV